jgi:hypothetical protein
VVWLKLPSPTSRRLTIGPQPQARMGGLHRLPHYLYEVLAQGKASRSVSSRKRELKASRDFLASYFLR